MEAVAITDPTTSWWSVLSVSAHCVLFLAVLLAATSILLVVRSRSAQGEARQLLAALSVLIWFAMLATHAYQGFVAPLGYLLSIVIVAICVTSAGQLLVTLVAPGSQLSGQAFSGAIVSLIRRAIGVTMAVLIVEALTSGILFDELLTEEEGIIFSLFNGLSGDASQALPGLLFVYAFFLAPYVLSRWLLVRAARKAGIVVPRYTNWVPVGIACLLLFTLVVAYVMSGEDDWADALESSFGSYLALGVSASVFSILSYDYFWDRSAGLISYIRGRLGRSPAGVGLEK